MKRKLIDKTKGGKKKAKIFDEQWNLLKKLKMSMNKMGTSKNNTCPVQRLNEIEQFLRQLQDLSRATTKVKESFNNNMAYKLLLCLFESENLCKTIAEFSVGEWATCEACGEQMSIHKGGDYEDNHSCTRKTMYHDGYVHKHCVKEEHYCEGCCEYYDDINCFRDRYENYYSSPSDKDDMCLYCSYAEMY